MGNRPGDRYNEYYDILRKNQSYIATFEETLDVYEKEYHALMAIEEKVYLMVFGPTIVEFVLWVLKDAISRGKNRLYFLSRDGFQMYLVARVIVSKYNLPINCMYLNVSRYSIRVPGFHLDVAKAIDTISTGGIDVTPKRILARGALSGSEIDLILNEMDLESKKDEILNRQQISSLRSSLRSSKYLSKFIAIHSEQEFDNAIGYLIQEGLCRDGKYALVDSGWVGTLQESIETLVNTVNPDISVEGYYFGMYDIPKGVNSNKFHSFYFSHNSGLVRKMHFSNSLFEALVSSEEGMTERYIATDSGYKPITNDNRNPNRKLIGKNNKAIETFINILVRNHDILTNESNIFLVEKLLTKFMSYPTSFEYSLFGSLFFTDDVRENTYKYVAERLTLNQIRNNRLLSRLLIMCGCKEEKIYESAWLEGSVVGAINENNSLPTAKLERLIKRELYHVRFNKMIVFLRKQIKGKLSK